MLGRPVIFISAVSRELRSARDLVAKTLIALGYDAKWQDIAATDTGDLRGVLRRWIDGSDAVIQLVGHCYGFAPKKIDPNFGTCSYTQYEALYARRTGKPVYYIFLAKGHDTDGCACEPKSLHDLQDSYRGKIKASGGLYHSSTSLLQTELIVRKLRDDLAQLRRRWKLGVALVLGFLLLLVLGILWLRHGQRNTDDTLARRDQKVDAVLLRNQQLEQALIRLADVEMHAKQLGDKLAPEQLRQRAYTILENELGIAAGILSKELPGFALELYNRSDVTPLVRARAAYALNKFDEAEIFFLESDARDRKALENAEKVAGKLREQRIEALIGAGQSAEAQVQYARSLEHFRAAAALTSRERAPLEWARVQWFVAQGLGLGNQPREAEAISRDVKTLLHRVLGSEHPESLASQTHLAIRLTILGRHAEAEKEIREVLTVQERLLGAEHPDTLASRDILVGQLAFLGKHTEAEREHRALLKIMERVLGPEHADTLTTRNNLAVTLILQGKHAEAEQEQRAILKVQERVLGAQHEDTLESRSTLAGSLTRLGRHAEAEKEYREVVDTQLRVLGAESPDLNYSRVSLARCLEDQGKLKEALDLIQQAEALSTRLLGTGNEYTTEAREIRERIEAKLK